MKSIDFNSPIDIYSVEAENINQTQQNYSLYNINTHVEERDLFAEIIKNDNNTNNHEAIFRKNSIGLSESSLF